MKPASPAKSAAPPPFPPPPPPEGVRYVPVMGDVWALSARQTVAKLRAAGIDAYAQENQISSYQTPDDNSNLLWKVFVAQSHLVAALIVLRLRGNAMVRWAKLSGPQRRRLAGKALLDGALLHGDAWDPAIFSTEGLDWLAEQLQLNDRQFQLLIASARQEYVRIGKRDLRWGLYLTLGCSLLGLGWAMIGSFAVWPVWVLLGLGLIFGVYTLAMAWPRRSAIAAPGLGGSLYVDLAKVRGRAALGVPDDEQPHPDDDPDTLRMKREFAETDAEYLDLARCIDRARALLAGNRAQDAMAALESFAARDGRGIHTAYPEFYELVRECERNLGRKRRAGTRIEDMRLDWVTALNRGQQLFRAGKAEESIAFFKRSLKANPGEAGTASGAEAARQGIKNAQKLLKRRHGRG